MDTEDDGVVYQSAMPDRVRRRRTVWVGLAGAAAVLGAGAYLITAHVVDRDMNTFSQDGGALVPVFPSVLSSPPPAATVSPDDKGPVLARPQGSAVRRSTSPTPAPPPSASALSVAGAPVNEHNVTTAEGTVRVVSAKFDLSGQGDLLLAADRGRPYGKARCTQKLRFAGDVGAKEMPSMLLCWRTSLERSVVTVAVASQGKPSPERSIKLMNEEWAKLD